MKDRGFIKWQPFNSLITPKEVLENTEIYEVEPTLFPEEKEKLAELIKTAYLAQSKITMEFYENNQIKELNTYIKNIDPIYNTLKLDNGKIIAFEQIHNLKEYLPK